MTRLRIALLPHVFVAGHRSPPHPPLITARDLRAAIAANAALMTFAGDDDAARMPAQATPFTAPAADAAPDRAAVSAPPVSAPDHAGRDRAA